MSNTCECGHHRDEHLGGGGRLCLECECPGFMPEDPDDHYPDRDREDDQ